MDTSKTPKHHWRSLSIALAALLALVVLSLGVAMARTGLGPRRMARIALDTARAVLDSRRVRSLSQGNYTNLVFLHQSTGANLIREGHLREQLVGSGLQLWDQGYNYLGITDPHGNPAGYSYSVPNDLTDPTGFAQVFRQREYNWPLNTLSGLLQHEVIILKSCFDPTSRIESDEQLEEYKAAYLEIRQRIGQHPEKLFILLTQPPLNPAETDAGQAARARMLADWLMSDEFKGGLANLYVFDLFDQLAAAPGSGPEANTLRSEYRDGADSHPNTRANEAIAPDVAAFIVQVVNEFRDLVR
jgi:hypothetical protein